MSSDSVNGFLADTDLPPSEPFDLSIEPEAESTDDTRIVNPPPNTCNVCGLPIERQPGQRGRLPKTHPECKAAKSLDRPRATRPKLPKAEAEKEALTALVIERFEGHISRAVFLLALFDPFDALVLRVNAPEILANLRSVLMRYDRVRSIALATEGSGSIAGLVIALLTTALPIMAHHGLIPSKRLSQMLLSAPMLMLRMQEMSERSQEGDFTAELIQRVKYQAEQARRKMQEENGDSDEDKRS